MKKLLFVAITILLVVACKQNTPDTTTQISKDTQTDFTSFGDVITSDNVLSQDDMACKLSKSYTWRYPRCEI